MVERNISEHNELDLMKTEHRLNCACLMCEIIFEIYNELNGERNMSEEDSANLRSYSMVRVKFPNRTDPAWDRSPVPRSGTDIGYV